MRIMLASLSCLVIGCEGPAGPTGPAGTNGSDGPPGQTGLPGKDGSDAGPTPWVVGAGVQVGVTGLTFDAAGGHVAFTLTDASGAPLDRTGHLTQGPVEVSFALAQLEQNPDGSPAAYASYTTFVASAPGGATATQAWTESSGTFETVDVTHGTYRYTFAASLAAQQPTLTQTVAALATRTFGSASAVARTTLSARPDGGAVQALEEVTATTCNTCHASLKGHGGLWTSPQQCVLCHTPQAGDPSTGNTLDFRVMIHKIHRGANLPSVVAGTPYQLVGYMQLVNDFSTVEFPQDIARCTACHAGALGDRWSTAPAKSTCTSCHDTTSFEATPPAGMVLHGGGAQPDTAPCTVCHPATGSIAGITEKHFTGLLGASAPTVALQIQSITNTAPGQVPVLTFQAMVNGAPAPLLTTPLTRLSATIAGPTTDESSFWTARIQGTNAVGTLATVDAASGIYSYTFPASGAIPPTATGSYTVGLEGFVQPSSTDPRYAAPNPTFTFAVTDATAQPRREIVAVEKCNSCHFSLAAHGGARNDPRYCVLCHNTGLQNTPASVAGGTSTLAFTVDFRSMIHKIHMGEQLTQGYAIGSSNWSDLRYPRAISGCDACHVAQNWTLPMANSALYLPSMQTLYTCPTGTTCTPALANWTTTPAPLPPQTSVCTSCHDAPYTAAHAQLNTTQSGVEACATCHGPGMDWDVAQVHGSP
jgi:OmcA/MtrC family decaheme c-type cytochrome